MPTGYMPAKKKPVPNRIANKLVSKLKSKTIKILRTAANNAQTKNTFEGENLSEIVKIANKNVPKINPTCTAEVKCANAEGSKLKFEIKSVIIAFPANHNDVQQNWEKTIMGKIYFLTGINFFLIIKTLSLRFIQLITFIFVEPR